MTGLLDQLAAKHRVYISDLRLRPALRWDALRDLSCYPDKERHPLREWEDAGSYLLGCEVKFENYEQVENSLKPFSLKLR